MKRFIPTLPVLLLLTACGGGPAVPPPEGGPGGDEPVFVYQQKIDGAVAWPRSPNG